MSYGVGHRRGSDLVLLCLCHRSAATASTGPLTRGPLCQGWDTKKMKRPKKKKKKRAGYILCFLFFSELHLATTWPHLTEGIIVDNDVYS